MLLDFSLLDPIFSPIAEQLVSAMQAKGYQVTPYYGLRTLQEQAKLYRQSRATATVNATIEILKEQGCNYLASILNDVGPQPTGAWRTNAMPGESYHEWGLAMDCLLTPGADSDYKVYADTAISLGLTAGYYFIEVDMGHVQLGSSSLPYGYTLKQINDHFETLNAQ